MEDKKDVLLYCTHTVQYTFEKAAKKNQLNIQNAEIRFRAFKTKEQTEIKLNLFRVRCLAEIVFA